MTRFAPASELATGGPLPLPATGLPEAVLVPDGLVPRHEISATTRLWGLHPSEQPFATGPRLSTRREPARRGAYIPARLCSRACKLTCRPTHTAQAPNSRRDAACRVSPRLRRRGQPHLYRLQSIPSRASSSLVGGGDVHFLSFLKRVGRVNDDPIADLEPAKNFKRRSEIASNADRVHMHNVVLVDDRHSRPLGAEQHGVYRDRNPRNRGPSRKMHLAERTRQQLGIFVGNIHFRVQGARRGIDGIGGARYRSRKFLAGKFLQRNRCLH